MTDKKLDQSFSATKEDFKISWQLFKENWKAFIKNELFVVLCIVILGLAVIIYFLFSPNLFNPNFLDPIFIILMIIAALGLFFIPLALMCCQYGLAYDIMSSGDMFAEFEGTFTYYKRHWWQYSILSLFTPWTEWSFPSMDANASWRNFPLEMQVPSMISSTIVLLFIYLIWFIIFINTLPSITALGQEEVKGSSFKKCFSESFAIFRKNKRRLFMTWGCFFIVFNAPSVILTAIAINFQMLSFPPIMILFIDFISMVISAIVITISYPMRALIATRIYNCTKIKA